jgi:DAPG hydrolase PhiG domain
MIAGMPDKEEVRVLNQIDQAIGRISAEITEFTSRISHGETRDLVIEHELPGVTPEMIDWWWDHIDNLERYRDWHPRSHMSFEWVQEGEGHVGRIHKVTERIGLFPSTLRVRWEEPDSVTIPRVYEHVNVGSILNKEGEPISWAMHQYESMPGGTRMRSTFRLPAKTPGWFRKALKKHNIEEMWQFPLFLPALYADRAGPAAG